ncbi:MAG TPA: SPASM domain-containing protein, partial [Ktedonobacteraceae bacterium]|nr:SPASM domain-containing protein [Ktedonobacteraceae bacterium]
ARVVGLHDYALRQAQQYGLVLDAQLLSNGVILSQASIDQLKARQIGITISLDGIGADHDSQRPFANGQGSFRYVDRTLTRLLASNVIPHITVTVSQRNLAGLSDVISYILERELPFTLNYYRDNECSTHIRNLQFADEQMITSMRTVFAIISHNLPKYSLMGSLLDKADLTSAHQHTCGVGRNYLVIDQRGGVAKCQADIKQTITTIERDDPLQVVRDDLKGIQSLSVDEKEGCRTCEWRYWCTGGCPLLTYRATGRYDVKSPNCNIYKALFPEVLRLEALRLLKYESPVSLEYATENL